jgi:hypothetical protein
MAMNPLVRAIPKQGSHESVLDESRSSMFRQSVRTLPIRTCSGILILARFLMSKRFHFDGKARLTGIKRWRGGEISLERNERRKSSPLAGAGKSTYPYTDYGGRRRRPAVAQGGGSRCDGAQPDGDCYPGFGDRIKAGSKCCGRLLGCL